MLEQLPKLFRTPLVMHDMLTYRFPHVSRLKWENYVHMNRMRLDTRTFTIPAMPYKIQVEPSSRCNLKCPLCPCGRGDLRRPSCDLPLADFRNLVDDMEDYLLFLLMWGWGEPFMNRDLPAMLRYASERGIQTVTSTNCHFLQDEDFVAEILRSGLTWLIVAVDSTSVKNYESYRKDGSGDRVLNGVEKLVALKRKLNSPTRINLRMVVMRQNEKDIDRNRDFARSLGVDFFTVKTANPGYDDDYWDAQMLPENPRLQRYEYVPGTFERVRSDRSCRRVWTMATIHSNGDAAACCRDYASDHTIGNIREQPLSQLWNGEASRNLRRKVLLEKNSIKICRHCDDSFRFAKKGGWWPEVTEFPVNGGLAKRIRTGLRNRLLKPKVREFLYQVRQRL